MSKNPVLKMSKVRQAAWLAHAEPDDFFEMVTLLARLYAKKIYTAKSGYKAGQLLADYPEYLKRKAQNTVFKNNVPFLSSSDAPGSYVEEPPAEVDPMDEINQLIDNIEL